MAINEALVLNGTAINDGTTFTLEALDMTPPEELEEWVKGADSDGARLGREPLVGNRVITASIRIEPQSTMDLALSKIATIVDHLKEAQRNTNGVALTWVPADATLSAVTFRCLSGQVTGLPIEITSGWFVKAPLITVKLTCLPFWEKSESQVATVTSSAPIITLELTGIGGDVSALGRIVVLDAASQSRRYVSWGMESRWYPTSSEPSLIVDSSSMVTSGFAGSTATRTAAYSGASNNVISATLRTQVQAICGLGNLAHVGVFRPQLRFYADATTMALRLTFKTLDGPYRSLSYKVPVAVGFNHVDLGQITIPQAVLGTQRWTGQIDAYSTAVGGEVFQVDAMWLMPAEQFGRARGTYSYAPGVVVGYDDFTGISSGTGLNSRVAPLGGTWATSGSSTDFVAADAPDTAETMRRTTNTSESGLGRLALLGSTTYTNVEAQVSTYQEDNAAYAGLGSVVARYVDGSNYLALERYDNSQGADTGKDWALVVHVAGVTTYLAKTITGGVIGDTWLTFRLICYTSGIVIGQMLNSTGNVVQSLRSSHSSLATGGALATGKVGFADASTNSGSDARYYDSFSVSTPASEPVVCYSGQTIEFRHDSVLREDSTGTYYGPPPEYVGARFTIPPAGGPGRQARVAVIARRNDIETALDDNLTSNATTDSTTVTVFKTERGLVVPR